MRHHRRQARQCFKCHDSGDSGREVGAEVRVMTLDMARSIPPKVIKGRQIVAMILKWGTHEACNDR